MIWEIAKINSLLEGFNSEESTVVYCVFLPETIAFSLIREHFIQVVFLANDDPVFNHSLAFI